MENPDNTKVRYNVDGDYYDIPSDKVGDFEQAMPQARQVYNVGEDTYEIPLDKRSGFTEQFPDAKPWGWNEQPQQPAQEPEKNGFWARLGRNLSQSESSPQGVTLADTTSQPKKKNERPDNWEERSAAFDDDYNAYMNEINARLEKRSEELKRPSMEREKRMGGLLSSFVNAGLAENGAVIPQAREEIAMGGDKESDQLRAAAQLFDSAKKVKDAAYERKGVGAGLSETVSTDNWDFGVTDLKTAQQVYDLAKKLESDEDLTENDQLLLEAMVQNAFSNEYYSDQLRRGYKAGKVTGESLPFMLEFILNPLSGGGKAASGGAVKVLEKRLAKEMAKRAEKFAVKGAEKTLLEKGGELAMKGLARGADDLVSAAGMAATTGAARTAADAYSRMNGQVQFHETPEGTLEFDGLWGGEGNWWKAAAKAYGATTIEDFSEMFGNYFRPIGEVSKKALYGLNKSIGLGKVNNFLDGIGAKEWTKAVGEFLDRTKWDGPLGEFGEEIVGGVLNALTVGDQTLKASDPNGVFNPDNLIDTFLGVALFGGAVSVMKTMGYQSQSTQNEIQREKISKEAESVFDEADWSRISKQIDGADENAIKEIIKVAFEPESEYSPKQKWAIGEYARLRMMQIGMDKGQEKKEQYVKQGFEEGQAASTPQDINRLQIDDEYVRAKAQREEETAGSPTGAAELEVEHADAVNQGRRESIRNQIVETAGQQFWSSRPVEGQEENATEDVVDVITYADGREAYVISSDNGTLAIVDSEGNKGFVTEAELAEMSENRQAVRDTVRLDAYLDTKIGEQNNQAEQQRMAQDAANNLAAIQRRVQEEGRINVGTPENEQIATVIDMLIDPAVGGVVAQVEGEAQPRVLTWDQVATSYNMPLEAKSNTDIVNERINAEEEVVRYNGAITPGTELVVPIAGVEDGGVASYQFNYAENVDGDVIIKATDPLSGQEVDLTPEMVSNLDVLLNGNEPAQPVADVQGNPVPEVETPSAPVEIFDDPAANALGISSEYAYTTKKGNVVVDGSKLWAKDPTLWAEWNDRNPNRVIPTKEYLSDKLKEIDKEVESARKDLEAEARGSQNPDRMDELQDNLDRKVARQQEVKGLVAKYEAAERQAEIAQQQAEQAAAETPASVEGQPEAAMQTAREIIDNAQAALDVAKSDEQKVEIVQKMLDDLGAQNTVVVTRENVIDQMREKGASEKSIREVAKMLRRTAATGELLEGFHDPSSKWIFMLADQIGTTEDVNRVHLHEDKHRENNQTGAHYDALRTGITRQELVGAMNKRKNTNVYGNLSNSELADEVMAVAAEIAEEEGVDAIPLRLMELGVRNEEFINFVQNNIDNGRRNGQRRHLERGNPLQPETSQVSGGQDGRNQQPRSAEVGRQGDGSVGGSAEGTRSGEEPGAVESLRFSATGENIARIDRAIANSAPSLSEEEANRLVSAMETNAENDPAISFTDDAWRAQFPNDRVATPIGEIKLGENQKTKLIEKGRGDQFGMMKPTLENPDVVLYKEDKNPPKDAERTGKLLFIKTFVDSDGEKRVNFESVTIRRDNLEISISSHIAEKDAIINELESDRVVYIREALLSNSSEGYLAEQNESVPDLVPTQENSATSENKDNEFSESANNSEEKFEAAKKDLADRGIADNGEEVRFSVRYVPAKDQEKKIIDDIVTSVGVSKAQAKRWLRSETSLAAIILDEQNSPYLNYEGDDRYTAIKQDSDYPQGTVDFNNICRKRLAFTNVYQRIQRAYPNTIITGSDLATIRQIMKDHGLMVACGLCYVEDRRQLLGEIARNFIDELKVNFENYAQGTETKQKNAAKFRDLIGNDTKEDLSIYDLITLEGSERLSKEHPGIYAAFQSFNAARGQQAGNLFQGYAEYKREILKWNKKKVDSVNANGGLRIFSYSDFEAHHLIDLVQIIQDCARKGVMIQGYTKVPSFARAVANTGIKLNRSLIPLGDTGIVDGKLAYDPVEGIDINDKDFLPDNDNVGNILIGINDEQIRLAMADPFVHYIIPYHSNQSGILRQMKQTGAWTNYKNEQTEKGENIGKHGVNIYTDVLAAAEAEGKPIKNEKQFVEKFLQVCKERGWTPRFARFLNTNEAGEYVYTPGYYKLLLDFKLFDENGRILPQKPVKADFDDAFNQTILEDYVKGEKENDNEVPEEVYDEITAALGLTAPQLTDAQKKALAFVNGTPVEENEAVRFSISGLTEALEKDGISVNDKAVLDEYGLSDLTMTKKGDVVTLNKIVAKENGKGAGTKFMNEFTAEADGKGWTMALTPDDTFGATSVSRLKKFYKRFGFKENKGKNTDFTINESMVRQPQKNLMFSITAYHGSGANFDKFDHSHMGEGEGNQAYGWGTYVASNRDVANEYAVRFGEPGNRHLYTVEIPDDNGQNYIHWEEPLTRLQAKRIMDIIRREADKEAFGEEFEYELQSCLGPGTYGRYVEGGMDYFLGNEYNYATDENPGAERNAKLLSKAGFTGIEIPMERGGVYPGSDYVIFNEDDVKITDNIQFSIRGLVGAANDDVAMQNLDTAQEMEEQGKDAKAIWLATGWEKGADGKWREEIPDGTAKVIPMNKRSFKVKDLIDAPELFESYPEIVDYKVSLKKTSGAGSFLPSKKEIELDSDYNVRTDVPEDKQDEAKKYFSENYANNLNRLTAFRRDVEKKFGERKLDDTGLRTMMHELQHAIQEIEGFAKGGSTAGQTQDVLSAEYKEKPNLVTFARAFASKNSTDRLLRFGREKLVNYIDRNLADFDYNGDSEEARRRMTDLRDHLAGLDAWGYRNLVYEASRLLRNAAAKGKEMYNNLAGEVESRNVEKRMGMTEKERANTPLSETEDVAREEQGVRFSIVTDPAKIAELEAGEKRTGYRTVAQYEDGSYGAPMADALGNKKQEQVKNARFFDNQWEQSDEHPELASEDGKITINKPDGLGELPVDYNPYIHIRPTMMNPQFTSAWKRPNLVFIETEYPASELTSGYKAEKAKKSVGKHPWNGGPLILSRYDKPKGVVPWEIVANDWVDWVKKNNKPGVTFDIVPPGLLPVLARRGVEILPPKSSAGDEAMEAYENWKKSEAPRFSITAEQDKEYMDAVNAGDMEKAQRMVDEAAKAAGYNTEAYHGTTEGVFTVFDNSKAEDKRSSIQYDNLFAFSSSPNTADTYRMVRSGNPKTGEKYGESLAPIKEIQTYDRKKVKGKDRMLPFDKLVNKYPKTLFGVVSPYGDWRWFDTKDEAENKQREYANMEYGEGQVRMHVLLNLGNAYSVDAEGDNYRSAISKLAKEEPSIAWSGWNRYGNWIGKINEDLGGYDALVVKNVQDNGGPYKAELSDVYFVKQPSQIKSAAPVTYDDNGNVIPLSERFNPGNEDIRFSVAYHGSPNAFDRFDSSHIGEGEGAQAHGWGTYVSLNRGTADRYSYLGGRDKVVFNGPNPPTYYADELIGSITMAIQQNKATFEEERDRILNHLRETERKRLAGEVGDYWKNQSVQKEIDYLEGLTANDFKINDVYRNIYTLDIPDDNGDNYINEMITLKKDGRRRIANVVRSIPNDRLQRDTHGPNWLPNGVESVANVIENRPFAGKEIRNRLVDAFGSEKFASEIMHDAGFVGMKYDGKFDGPCVVIFDENDIRIDDHEQIRFSVSNANQRVFVSNAERAVESIRQEKATPEQWLKMIEKNGGLKAGEDKWLGLSEWLKSQDKKSLTKQEVLDYIDENQIKIEETHYAGDLPDVDMTVVHPDWEEAFHPELDEFRNRVYWEVDDPVIAQEIYETVTGETIELDENDELPDNAMGILYDFAQEQWQKELNKQHPINQTRLHYTTDGLENKHEIALTVPTIDPWNQADSIHFGDAGEGRAIAWTRFGDATQPNEGIEDARKAYSKAAAELQSYAISLMKKYSDDESGKPYYELATSDEKEKLNSLKAEESRLYQESKKARNTPKKVLFIDEIQSKRHQEGREKGYKSSMPDPTIEMREDLKRKEARLNEISSTWEQDDNADQEEIYRLRALMEEARNAKEYETLEKQEQDARERIASRRGEYNRLRAEINDLRQNIETEGRIVEYRRENRIPDAPFEKNWPELAMKRMLRYAAENGYDVVAWTTGDQQAERYNIGNVLQSVDKVDDNEYTLYLTGGQSTDIEVDDEGIITKTDAFSEEWEGKRLSDVVGKELAVKMMSMEVDSDDLDHIDSRIGGEGMRGFYDQILPRFMNKYGKQWGVKVSDELVTLSDGAMLEAHTVPVTQEMKDSVMEGQLMFSVSADEQADRQRLIDAAEKDGLKGVIGEEGVQEIYREAYASIPKEDLRPIVEKGLAEGGDIRKQLKIYLHDLAKNGTENDSTGLLFKLFDDIRFMTSNPALTDNDIRWMLFKETSDANEGDLLALAEERAMKNRWGVGQIPAEQQFKEATEEAAQQAEERMADAEKNLGEAKEATKLERDEAWNALWGEADSIAKAMAAQKTYDKATVDSIVRFAKEILKNGNVSELTLREVSRLLTLVNSAAGKSPKFATRYAEQLMDMLLDHIAKDEEAKFMKLVKVKASKVNQSGVEVQGKMDLVGQAVMKAFRDNMDSPVEDIQQRIEEVSERISDNDDAVREGALAEYSGLMMALQYKENIADSIEEYKDLKKAFDEASVKLSDLIGRKAYDEYIKQSKLALRTNLMERIDMYRDLSNQLVDLISGSAKAAAAFRKAEQQRIEDIHHDANRDMQGVPAKEHLRENAWQRFLNSDFARFFLKSLDTADQMFRLLGRKSVTGEGYLFRRYIDGWQTAAGNASKGIFAATRILDEKVSEVYGRRGMKWSDLYKESRKPGGEVEFVDGDEMRTHTLTQGNLLYIYMANKMTDGKMKLRRMGISEEDVEDIKKMLDPKLIELADWLQNEFYVNLRNKYNAVHERMFGAPMSAIEDYVPLKILANARFEDVDLGAQTQGEMSSTITGSIIKRRRNSLALDIMHTDAFSLAIEHIEQMEDWAAFAELRRDMNTLLSYKRFRNQVQNMNTIYGSGRTLWKNFSDVCTILVGKYQPKVKKGDIDTMALNVAKGVTAAKIAFRVNTAIKQILSFPAYASDARVDFLAKGLATPWASWKWCMENLPLFEKRWKSRIAGDTRLMDTTSDWKIWRDNVVRTAGRLGMTPNAFVDATTVAVGAKAMYDTKKARYIKDGYSEEKADEMAKRDAEILYNQTQQSSENAFVSPVQLDRTVMAVTLTTYRNSSMAYQRQLHDAIRTTAKMMKPGYRQRSIDFMTHQNENNGLDEEQARTAATREYNRQYYRNLVRVAVFGYGLQFLWKIGNDMWYLLFGDDDDEKKKILEEAALAELAAPVEGLVGGNVMSDRWGSKAKKAINEKYGIEKRNSFGSGSGLAKLPIESDTENILSRWENDKPRAINDIIDLMVQAGIGVNPQTLTDAVVAVIDYADGDLDKSKEMALLMMRILQMPQSTIEKFLIDEIDMDADPDVRKEQIDQLAKRYAMYKLLKNTTVANKMYEEGKRDKKLESYEKQFKTSVKERMALKETATGQDIPDTPEDFYKDFEKRMKAFQTEYNRTDVKNDNDTLTRRVLEESPEFQEYLIWKKHQKGLNKLKNSIEKTQDDNLRQQWEAQRRDSIQAVINELNVTK